MQGAAARCLWQCGLLSLGVDAAAGGREMCMAVSDFGA